MLCLRYYPKYHGILKTLGRLGLTQKRTWGGNFKKETNSTSGDVSVVKTYIPVKPRDLFQNSHEASEALWDCVRLFLCRRRKYANVTPIHKKSDKQFVKNYRPISLLQVCAKLFEKILFKNIYNRLISNKKSIWFSPW